MNEIMQVKPWGECLIIKTQYYYYDYSYGSTVGGLSLLECSADI